jgi:hypothetical protein
LGPGAKVQLQFAGARSKLVLKVTKQSLAPLIGRESNLKSCYQESDHKAHFGHGKSLANAVKTAL